MHLVGRYIDEPTIATWGQRVPFPRPFLVTTFQADAGWMGSPTARRCAYELPIEKATDDTSTGAFHVQATAHSLQPFDGVTAFDFHATLAVGTS